MLSKPKTPAIALLSVVAWGYFSSAAEVNAQTVTIELVPDYIGPQVGDTVYVSATIENHQWWLVTVTGCAELTLPNGRIIHRDAPRSVILPPFFSYTIDL